MRFALSLRRRFLVCFALSVALSVFAHGIARGQEETPASDATTTDTATEPATEGAAPADGEQPQRTAQEIFQEIYDKRNEILKQGQEALRSGDNQTALQAFDQLARLGEQMQFSQEANQLRLIGYTGRGQALVGMKEYDAALEEFKLVADLDENFVPALLARGRMLLDIGGSDNAATALSDFQKAVKADRGNLGAQFGYGKALVLTGNYQAAIGPLTRVIEAVPDNAEAYRLRGTGYSGTFKYNEALADLNKSLELNSDDYETYYALAALALRNEDFQEGADQLGKAIEHYKPKNPDDKLPFVQGILTRSNVFVELGKTMKEEAAKKAAYQAAIDEAEKVLAQVDKKNPYTAGVRAAALYARGIGERMLGQLRKAVHTFSEAIELSPDMAEAYYRRGICHHYLGEDKSALADFVESANINFEDPRANLWEGFTHAKMGNFHEALRAYGNAIAASDRYTPAFLNRGLAYMALGEYEKALADFNDAVRLEPTNPDYYFKRGLAYEQLGNFQKAAESFTSAIEFNNAHAAAYRHLADAMQRLGNTDLANQYRQKASELESKQNAK
ncbi:MAG: tetratricopeptide repeat protein [Planctomycetes bacterium]|nr:tetratricopeptide repeat protein [Planctomycetota bacterium]